MEKSLFGMFSLPLGELIYLHISLEENSGNIKFTEISPNKSVEGCIAGLFGSIIMCMVYTVVVCNSVWNLNISYIYIFGISIFLSVISQIGDLAASSVKRYCDIKDFSNLIPGHGGIIG